MNMEEKIKQALHEAMPIDHLEVINESYKHHGHAGDDGSGQTHFKLKVASSSFLNCSRMQQHKQVNAAIQHLFEEGLHAVSMSTIILEGGNK